MWGNRPGPSRDFREFVEAVNEKINEALRRLCDIEGRISKMPTVQDLKDALDEQNADITELMDAIAAEVQQINDALSGAGNIPQEVLDTVKGSNARVKSAVDEVKGIIADPLPEPAPGP